MSVKSVDLSDLRCWELWQLNDVDLLKQIAQTHPEILLPKEWEAIEQHLFFLKTEESYREYCSARPPCPLNPDHIQWEYRALTTAPRWQFVVAQVLPQISPPQRALDLGTWTGAHAVWLSNLFPDATVYAREIVSAMRPAIEETVRTRACRPENLVVEIGDHLLPPLPRNLDLVYAGEVLEHVRDVDEFIRAVEGACRPEAWVILTTPIESVQDSGGPNDQHVHVRHLEREDLWEMFCHKRNFALQIIPPRWIVTWYQVSPAVGPIDYDRKMRKWRILP